MVVSTQKTDEKLAKNTQDTPLKEAGVERAVARKVGRMAVGVVMKASAPRIALAHNTARRIFAAAYGDH